MFLAELHSSSGAHFPNKFVIFQLALLEIEQKEDMQFREFIFAATLLWTPSQASVISSSSLSHLTHSYISPLAMSFKSIIAAALVAAFVGSAQVHAAPAADSAQAYYGDGKHVALPS